MKRSITYCFFICLVSTGLRAQTCCSGGTPLIGNLGIQELQANSWYIQLGYDYNFLNDLYTGSDLLDDETRERLTQSVLLQVIYAFSDKWSVNALFSFVDQKRTIFSTTGATNITQTSGIGDAVILGQYTAFSKLKRSLTFALGPKLPIGKFDAEDPEFGLVLSPDMQPGTGSLDAIFGMSFQEHHLFNQPGFTFGALAGYRHTTPAKRFEGDFKYRFGNEIMLSFGLRKNLQLKRMGISPSVNLAYRNTSADQVDGASVAGTGGNWFNLNPGLNIDVASRIALLLGGELPLYRNLNGTQLTTSYRWNVGISYKIY